MSGLVLLAAIVALLTRPSGDIDTPPTAASVIAWAVVVVSMIAGIVTWAVMR